VEEFWKVLLRGLAPIEEKEDKLPVLEFLGVIIMVLVGILLYTSLQL